jgi:two-component system chemotaxis sensor kinase CheA
MIDNLLMEFLAECREHLAGIESDLLTIEESGANADQELVNKVFRAAHSIKGGAGFFHLDTMKTLAHRTETVLDMVRSKLLKPQPEVINILLTSFDKLRELVNNPKDHATIDITPFVTALQDLASQNLRDEEKDALIKKILLTSLDGTKKEEVLQIDLQSAIQNQQYIYVIEYDMLHDIDRVGKSPITLLDSLSKVGVIIDSEFDIFSMGTLDDVPATSVPLKLIYRTVLEPAMIDAAVLVDRSKTHVLYNPCALFTKPEVVQETTAFSIEMPSVECEDAIPVNEPAPPVEQELPEHSAEQVRVVQTDVKTNETQNNISIPDTLRINVELLDVLMVQAGELVLSRNQLLDAISRGDKRTISTSAQHLSFVISELQEAVMRTRLQAVGNVLNKFPRVVRDMSISLKKELRLITEGKDVELDKTIVEGLSDPLTHMVRNAADHGIESPQARARAGKPPVGTIILRAFHEAGQVAIEVSDDGKGIDGEKVARKALSMGLITQERLQGMSESDKIALIFLPGLSTADKVTETSGRGVGMDVVKTNLDKLGGKVDIRSIPNEGTTFRIKLPLTLAIIPSLIISEEGEQFALPQVNIRELLRIPAAQVQERIEVVGDAEVVVLRGKVIPLVRFSTILGVADTYLDPLSGVLEIDRRQMIADRRSPHYALDEKNNPDDRRNLQNSRRKGIDRRACASSDLNIIIVATGLLQYGLVVDELRNNEEIVVKPLGRHLKSLPEYAGATIMGNGEVALILDATGIALKAGITSVSSAERSKQIAVEEENQVTEGTHSLLLFDNEPGEQCAVPLDLVQRVERIQAQQIETRGGCRTMQYRGASLPLIQLADVAKVKPIGADGVLAVVVTSVAGHDVGLLCMMPVSVIECDLNVDTTTHRQPGISGSAIISDKTVLMVDILEIINILHPDWGIEARSSLKNAHGSILLAEDSDFFRSQVSQYLTDAGYEVIAAKDGAEGWELMDLNAAKIKIVVTDIEMPRMSGLDLTRKIRSDDRFVNLPIIALTSLVSEEDEARGKEAGITEYQIKLDRDRLIESVKGLFA